MTSNFQHVGEPFSGDESTARQVSLQQRIGGDRRAVGDAVDRVEPEIETLGRAFEATDHSGRGIFRGCRRLQFERLPRRLIEDLKIRKRAASVDGNAHTITHFGGSL